jgi:hypothetical protein
LGWRRKLPNRATKGLPVMLSWLGRYFLKNFLGTESRRQQAGDSANFTAKPAGETDVL